MGNVVQPCIGSRQRRTLDSFIGKGQVFMAGGDNIKRC